MVEVSTELAALLDQEIARRTLRDSQSGVANVA
jgi:hypothetical protein